MAWTSPSIKTTGLLVTAAIWNEQVTNNMTFLGASHDHSGDSGDGATISGLMPSGAILPFDNSCLVGWTRFSALDGKFIRGAASYAAAGGGANTHLHTGPAHDHSGPSHTHTIGTHTHTAETHVHTGAEHDHKATRHYHQATAGGVYTGIHASSGIVLSGTANVVTNGAGATSASGNGTTGAGTGTTGSGGTANTSTESTLPSYIEVVFCKKD